MSKFYYTTREGGPWLEADAPVRFDTIMDDIEAIYKAPGTLGLTAFHSMLVAPGYRWDSVNRTWHIDDSQRSQWKFLRARDGVKGEEDNTNNTPAQVIPRRALHRARGNTR